ncbi:MAG: hypothetical protein AAFZ89_14690 [Bacteroidota bacterium]
MERRNFILLSAGAALALGASYWYLKYEHKTYPKVIAEPEDLSYIWEADTIRNIGNQYRMGMPEEDNEKSLVGLLNVGDQNKYKAIETLQKEIQKDFDTGNTIILDGWILSRTEARQCALFSIVQPN